MSTAPADRAAYWDTRAADTGAHAYDAQPGQHPARDAWHAVLAAALPADPPLDVLDALVGGAAVILDFAQVPTHMMPAMFTSGRTAGWAAHILEQKRLGKLVRPAALYVGPEPRSPESVEGWDQISKA